MQEGQGTHHESEDPGINLECDLGLTLYAVLQWTSQQTGASPGFRDVTFREEFQVSSYL